MAITIRFDQEQNLKMNLRRREASNTRILQSRTEELTGTVTNLPDVITYNVNSASSYEHHYTTCHTDVVTTTGQN